MIAVEATPRHVEDAIGWMVARGMPALPADTFASTGFVVPGVAGCWLYLTNSSLAYLEMLVTNPAADVGDRDRAQDLVIFRCLEEAREEGCRTVIAPVARPCVLRRAERLGFIVVARELSLIAFPLGGT